MAEQNDGGAAFPMPAGPEPRVNSTTHFNEGMSLRDWFAEMAMQGMIAGLWSNDKNQGWSTQGNVVAAYEYADAMLAARNTKEANHG